MTLDYYLALLQLHIAVVGVAAASVAALIQLVNNAKPHRDFRLVVQPWVLVVYGLLLFGLLVLLAGGSWVGAFPAQAHSLFGDKAAGFFDDGVVGLAAVAIMLFSLLWLVQLAFKVRGLLDSQDYVREYVRRTTATSAHRYLAMVYGGAQAEQGIQQNPHGAVPKDPFQPIREYIKDSAFKDHDYGVTDGLRQFGMLFDKALASSRDSKDEVQCVHLARYLGTSCEELFRVFTKTSSEKHRLDVINLLADKGMVLLDGLHDTSHDSLLYVVRDLEEIAKLSDDDDEIILAIERIRQLCDAFLESHKKASWAHIDDVFDEICLSVTRISEEYYLQKNNSLKTVPVVGYKTGKHHTVTTSLVDFFCAYRDLGDRHTDTLPVLYFEAIEGVIEVLFIRLGDIVRDGQQDIGFTVTYHKLARELYTIYGAFGEDAVEHGKPELLGLVLSNVRRIIKPAKKYGLDEEQQELTAMVIKLAAEGIGMFGDVVIKTDGRTISQYVSEILSKHTVKTQVAETLKELDKNTLGKERPAAVADFIKLVTAFA